MGEDNVAFLETGAAANLVCLRWPRNHNSLLGEQGLPRISTYPACARFKFGDGRHGEVRYAAVISVGLAGCKREFTAVLLEADIPALLREWGIGNPGRPVGVPPR